jgi:hypothetical protein
MARTATLAAAGGATFMSERLTDEQLRALQQSVRTDTLPQILAVQTAVAELHTLRARVAQLEAALEWRRVNDEPFEYAIRQGQHGDEFIRATDGACLRRAALDDAPGG